MEINPTEIVNLIVNGGANAVLLYLLLREQGRSQRLEDRVVKLAEEIAQMDARMTREMRAVSEAVTNGR